MPRPTDAKRPPEAIMVRPWGTITLSHGSELHEYAYYLEADVPATVTVAVNTWPTDPTVHVCCICNGKRVHTAEIFAKMLTDAIRIGKREARRIGAPNA